MFERAGKKNSNVTNRQFWQQNNKPIEIYSLSVFEQKLNYIHNNPVEAGFVTNPIDWKYSSAETMEMTTILFCRLMLIDFYIGYERDARTSGVMIEIYLPKK
jgi:hypothetical protein